MLSGQYRFKFYINASHGIYIDGKLGELHPHTWEIILTLMKGQEGFAPFHEIEKLCEASFARYQDGILNEIPPFTTVNPTLENIATVLRDDVRDALRAQGWLLLTIEVSETPSRSFIIHTTSDYTDRSQPVSAGNEAEIQRALDRLSRKNPHIQS
jgi:6-pyruvoyltetrahydropterin/6-carboxytetrahydropterin synthase